MRSLFFTSQITEIHRHTDVSCCNIKQNVWEERKKSLGGAYLHFSLLYCSSINSNIFSFNLSYTFSFFFFFHMYSCMSSFLIRSAVHKSSGADQKPLFWELMMYVCMYVVLYIYNASWLQCYNGLREHSTVRLII